MSLFFCIIYKFVKKPFVAFVVCVVAHKCLVVGNLVEPQAPRLILHCEKEVEGQGSTYLNIRSCVGSSHELGF